MRSGLSVWLASLLMVFPCLGAAPDGADAAVAKLRASIVELEKAGDVSPEALREAARDAMAPLRGAELRPSQLARLEVGMVLRFLGPMDRWVEQVRERAADRDAEGAAAAVLLAYWTLYASPEVEVNVKLLRDALTHPGLAEAVRLGGVPRLFSMVWIPGPEIRARLIREIASLEGVLNEQMHPWVACDLLAYDELLAQLALEDHPELRARAAPKMAEVIGAAIETLEGPEFADEGYDEDRRALDHVAKQLHGAAAKGVLLGHPVPEAPIIWSSDEPISSWRDLQGRVVLVDFWATWCGPCIRAFPELRRLQERFADEQVVIVGVTRLWGRYTEGSGEQRLQVEAGEELAAMPGFMKARNMTWPVVFADKQLFDDFGVRGIPHVAVVDGNGVVVANGVSLEEAERMIAERLDRANSDK